MSAKRLLTSEEAVLSLWWELGTFDRSPALYWNLSCFDAFLQGATMAYEAVFGPDAVVTRTRGLWGFFHENQTRFGLASDSARRFVDVVEAQMPTTEDAIKKYVDMAEHFFAEEIVGRRLLSVVSHKFDEAPEAIVAAVGFRERACLELSETQASAFRRQYRLRVFDAPLDNRILLHRHMIRKSDAAWETLGH